MFCNCPLKQNNLLPCFCVSFFIMATVLTVIIVSVCLKLATGAVNNAAGNKPASMSSRQYKAYKAATAVDGNTTAVWPGGIIHTDIKQPFAWWKVDLERDVQDATVEIYFRTDYKFRRNGVQIYTSTTPFSSYPEGQLCHTFTGNTNGTDIDDVVSVMCPGRWRYLLVYTKTANDVNGPVLDFGEVKVLVCTSGTYGSRCSQLCSDRHCLNSSASCNSTSGSCDGDCRSGWWQADCTEECTAGTYGINCEKKCISRPCLKPDSLCDRRNGFCPVDCQDGWTGVDCLNPCLSGFYGTRCNKTCGQCTGEDVCDHMTGDCPGDCQAGWRGRLCQEASACYGISTVIGSVIGSILVVLAVTAGICLCLIRQGRLHCVSVKEENEPSRTSCDNIRKHNPTQKLQTETENAHISSSEIKTENQVYEVI